MVDTTTRPPEAPGTPQAGPPRRRWRRVLVVALAVVVLAELGARVVDARLEAADGWHLPLIGTQLAALDAAVADGPVDVVLLGSSSIGAGVDPEDLGARLGGSSTAFNAWLAGPAPEGVHRYATEVVLPAARPQVVVVGVTSRELNDAGRTQRHQLVAMTSSPAWGERTGEESALARLDREVSRWSALVRHRNQLRDPGRRFLQSLRREVEPEPVGAQGMLLDRLERDLTLERDHLAQEREALLGFEVGGAAADDLEALLVDLRSRGIEVLVVDVPVLEDTWAELHPGGAADVARYRAVLDEVAARAGVDVVPAATARPWPPELFGDVNHLNRRGAAELSAIVAEELAQRGWLDGQ